MQPQEQDQPNSSPAQDKPSAVTNPGIGQQGSAGSQMNVSPSAPQYPSNSGNTPLMTPAKKKGGAKIFAIIGVVIAAGIAGVGGYLLYSSSKNSDYNKKQIIQTSTPSIKITAPAPLKKLDKAEKENFGISEGIVGKQQEGVGFKLTEEALYAQYENGNNNKKPVAALYYAIYDMSSAKSLLEKINSSAEAYGRPDLKTTEAQFLTEVRKQFAENNQELVDSIKSESNSGNLKFTEVSEPVAAGNGIEMNVKATSTKTNQNIAGKVGIYLDNEWKLSMFIALAEVNLWEKYEESFGEIFNSVRTGTDTKSARIQRRSIV